jgi:hypothetical protein
VAAAGGRVGAVQGRVDRLQHPVQVALDVAVPKSKDAEALPRQILVATNVPRFMFGQIVLPTVEFDDELLPQADKINDVFATRRLATEMVATISPGAKVNPHLHLLRRHGLA